MKKFITLLCITICTIQTSDIAHQQPKYTNIKTEIGNHRLAILNQNQISWINDILKNLSEIERQHFFISFNHNFDTANKFRQETTVYLKLSKLQYHDSSRISPKDIDHIIQQAHKHALSY